MVLTLRRLGLGSTAMLVTTFCMFGEGRAQVDDPTFELDNQQVQIESLRDLEAIRGLSADVFALSCPGVTYEHILADPDNIALNICYARQSIELGDFSAAQITLERLLLIDPNFVEARYFYAVLLYRMGNTLGA